MSSWYFLTGHHVSQKCTTILLKKISRQTKVKWIRTSQLLHTTTKRIERENIYFPVYSHKNFLITSVDGGQISMWKYLWFR
jgi:hypothetical protein